MQPLKPTLLITALLVVGSSPAFAGQNTPAPASASVPGAGATLSDKTTSDKYERAIDEDFASLRVFHVEGIAEWQKLGGESRKLTSGHKVQPGDSIILAEKALVKAALADGSVIRIAAGTNLAYIGSSFENGKPAWEFRLKQGTANVYLADHSGQNFPALVLQTYHARLESYKSQFLLTADSKQTDIYVFSGAVQWHQANADRSNGIVRKDYVGADYMATATLEKLAEPHRFSLRDLADKGDRFEFIRKPLTLQTDLIEKSRVRKIRNQNLEMLDELKASLERLQQKVKARAKKTETNGNDAAEDGIKKGPAAKKL